MQLLYLLKSNRSCGVPQKTARASNIIEILKDKRINIKKEDIFFIALLGKKSFPFLTQFLLILEI